jgi:hypothetical protein
MEENIESVDGGNEEVRKCEIKRLGEDDIKDGEQ